MFSCLMDFYGFEGFFKEKFPLLRCYIRKFEELTITHVEEVHRHFEKENVFPAVYLHQWFLTAFVNCLPLQTVVVLWDFLVCRGLPGLLQIALALLQVLKKALVKLSFEGIITFLKGMKTRSQCNENVIGRALVKQADMIKLPHELEVELMDYNICTLLEEATKEEQEEVKVSAEFIRNCDARGGICAIVADEKKRAEEAWTSSMSHASSQGGTCGDVDEPQLKFITNKRTQAIQPHTHTHTHTHTCDSCFRLGG
eukprot:GHVR01044086.1.p1 GENE.GHVR01044086.1~~GHVR01044086.1.p1  ORF type:complete len:255 (+),score=67.76 GHVR01044086.1:426-1190(+)